MSGPQWEPGAEGELRWATAAGSPGVLAQALQHRGRERPWAGPPIPTLFSWVQWYGLSFPDPDPSYHLEAANDLWWFGSATVPVHCQNRLCWFFKITFHWKVLIKIDFLYSFFLLLQGGTNPRHGSGNDYFQVPGHTPVIFSEVGGRTLYRYITPTNQKIPVIKITNNCGQLGRSSLPPSHFPKTSLSKMQKAVKIKHSSLFHHSANKYFPIF